MSAVPGGTREVQYLVLPDPSNPWLLARVRWPDVFEAISAAEPDWRADPGLFDLPYDPNSHRITADEAAAIAEEWGSRLPGADDVVAAGPLLLRRMPANWSDPSKAEKRAWAIESMRVRTDAAARKLAFRRSKRRDEDVSPERELPKVASDEPTVVIHMEPEDVIDLTDAPRTETVMPKGLRRRLKRREPASGEPTVVIHVDPDDVIDLADARQDALTTADDA